MEKIDSPVNLFNPLQLLGYSISIGIPTRYIHSHASIIHKDDYDNTVKLISEFIKRLNNKELKGILEY